MIELANTAAKVVIDPDNGARVVSFEVGGVHLLRTADQDNGGTHWGAFLMAPWAGRTRRGQFSFEGKQHQLEINAAPHAMHGTVRHQAWTVEESGANHVRLRCDFGKKWPFAGWAEHAVAVLDDRVDLEISMHAADGPMPAVAGWHPWW